MQIVLAAYQKKTNAPGEFQAKNSDWIFYFSIPNSKQKLHLNYICDGDTTNI